MHQCPDGLIRLTLDQLLSTPLKHLVSGVDVGVPPPLQACGTQTVLCGYTEWVSVQAPTISIGWDWRLQPTAAGARWVRVGLPRSNLMLTQDTGDDASWHGNLAILGTVVDALAWREIVPEAVGARYI